MLADAESPAIARVALRDAEARAHAWRGAGAAPVLRWRTRERSAAHNARDRTAGGRKAADGGRA